MALIAVIHDACSWKARLRKGITEKKETREYFNCGGFCLLMLICICITWNSFCSVDVAQGYMTNSELEAAIMAFGKRCNNISRVYRWFLNWEISLDCSFWTKKLAILFFFFEQWLVVIKMVDELVINHNLVNHWWKNIDIGRSMIALQVDNHWLIFLPFKKTIFFKKILWKGHFFT